MHLGILTLSPALLAFVAAGAVGWIILFAYGIPRAKLDVSCARGAEIPGASARLVVWRGLKSLSLGMVLAPIAVVTLYGYAQWRIEESASDPEKLQSLISARALLERILEPLTAISLEVWIFGLLAISAIWLAARGSASRRRWNRALEARRQAHAAALSSMSIEDLLLEAKRSDAAAFARIEARAASVEAKNRQEIQTMEDARVLSFGGNDGENRPTSISELRELIAHFGNRADELETISETPEPPDQPEREIRTGDASLGIVSEGADK